MDFDAGRGVMPRSETLDVSTLPAIANGKVFTRSVSERHKTNVPYRRTRLEGWPSP
jgi:hypothetical protein